MQKANPRSTVGVLNLDAVENIGIRNGRLFAALASTPGAPQAGDTAVVERIVVSSQRRIVGQGRVTDTLTVSNDQDDGHHDLHLLGIELRQCDPVPLKHAQRDALRANCRTQGMRFKKLAGILPLSTEASVLFPFPVAHDDVQTLGGLSEAWRRSERERIYNEASYSSDERLERLQALDCGGAHAQSIDALFPLVSAETDGEPRPCPILPWDRCTDAERLDPHNGIVLSAEFAAHFNFGLLTFDDDGRLELSAALVDDITEFGLDPNYELCQLSTRQRSYLRRHREHIFEQWRVSPPWLSASAAGHC